MQVCEVRSPAVQRDMDMIRDILVLINDGPEYDGTREFTYSNSEEFGISNHSTEEVAYHLALLINAGFVDGAVLHGVPMHVIRQLTWNGHEFLDNIRDPGIWNKTKERLAGLQSAALSVVAEVAKAEVKKRLGLT